MFLYDSKTLKKGYDLFAKFIPPPITSTDQFFSDNGAFHEYFVKRLIEHDIKNKDKTTMNKKEAIIAMVKDGKKIRCLAWDNSKSIHYCDKEKAFISKSGLECDINDYANESKWEIVEDPQAKTKYYRRKWLRYKRSGVEDYCPDTIIIPDRWFAKKDEHDSYWRCSIMDHSQEWEEMELEV